MRAKSKGCGGVNVHQDFHHGCQHSVTSVATRYGLEGPGFEPRWGWGFPYPPRPSLGPTMGTWFPSRGSSGRVVALTTHPLPAPRLCMGGAIPLLHLGSFMMVCYRLIFTCLPPTWVTNGRIRDGFESESSVQYVHRQPSWKTRTSNSRVSALVLQYCVP